MTSDEVPTRKPIRAPWHRWARVLAFAGALLAVAFYIWSLPSHLRQLVTLDFGESSRIVVLARTRPDPDTIRPALSQLGLTTEHFAGITMATELLMFLVFCGVAVLLARRANGLWAGTFVPLVLVIFAVGAPTTTTALAQFDPRGEIPGRVLGPLAWWLFPVFMLTFPDGRFVPRWTVGLAAASGVWILLWAVFPMGPFNATQWPVGLAFGVWACLYSAIILAQVYRYGQATTLVARQQTKWVVTGLVVTILVALAAYLPLALNLPGDWPPGTAAVYALVRPQAIYLATLLIPATIGVAILRYRLWEIDTLLNRTLVYIPLTAILGGLYTASIGLFQRVFVAFTGNTSDAAIVLTTLVVAAAFTPVRGALQLTVDRRFKEAPDRMKALRDYQRQMQTFADTLDLRKASIQLLERALASFGAVGGQIQLELAGRPTFTHASAAWEGEPGIIVPLECEGERLGMLTLGPRPDRGPYSREEQVVLEQTAGSLAQLAFVLVHGPLAPCVPPPDR